MSKKAITLLIINGLFALSIGLSNVFVNIFLWKKTNDFILIAFYNLMSYSFALFAFILAGFIAKKKSGTWSLRIGVALFVLFFLLMFVFKKEVPNYAYYFGMLFGSASGFYWLSFHILSFDFTSLTNRDTYNGFNGAIVGVSNAIAPLFASYIIDRNEEFIGYSIIFGISLFLFLLLTLISFFIKSSNYNNAFSLRKIANRSNDQWNNIRNSITLWGFRDVVILFLINVLIFKHTNSVLILGQLTFFAYLLSSLAYLTEQKFIKPKRRWLSFHIGALFMFLSVVLLSVDINIYYLIVFIIIDAISVPFFFVPMTSATFNIIDESKDDYYRTEYIISREIALNTGRIISTSILILVLTVFNNDDVLNYFLVFIGSAPLWALYFLRKLKIWH
ncbi:YQGE family putative transporter [Natranaerovirga hydrolytica]|uniref:YQGE family putative transporter n=1 Tax=Natranaerovirga hydrolytica TaxID=680378 RepID=A0A4R1N6B7_9FIRM|nr:MFS transporter [Natranaerovirga hydrolytica]TCK98569.1 YQGE family putative transporter [Natranaerovirga hydrolytica]